MYFITDMVPEFNLHVSSPYSHYLLAVCKNEGLKSADFPLVLINDWDLTGTVHYSTKKTTTPASLTP